MDTPAEDARKPGQVDLDEPIKRGDTEISRLFLRRPQSGELRGLNLSDLLNSSVDALITVLPRITNPPITEVEAAGLDPADLVQCGSEVVSFLLSKDVRAAFRPT